MKIPLLESLCNAAGIAMQEAQVRSMITKNCYGEVSYDGLGSVISHHQGKGPKIMVAAHMDEVGFMVRHIHPDGLLYLTPIGGVENRAKTYQKVYVHTQDGKKIIGLLQQDGEAVYVDIGVASKEAIAKQNIEIGNMATFASQSEWLNETTIMAKALDDRVGCYTLLEVEKKLSKQEHPNDIYFCYTSSEEVGTRGGKCTSQMINPDIIFVIDVASGQDTIRNYTNHRKLGEGYLIVHYDKTMIPNPKLLQYIKTISNVHHLKYQCDMFGGGGTDGAYSHLVNEGKLALVLGVPLRYCHGSYSMCNIVDVQQLITLLTKVLQSFSKDNYKEIKDFK